MTATPSSPRLPPAGVALRLLASPLGALLARPWFDRAALWGLARWYFPLSRAWAAAAAADGSVERFRAELPLSRLPDGSERGVVAALRRVASLRAAHAAADRRWQTAFFGDGRDDAAALVAAERGRRAASHAYMMARAAFVGLARRAALPAVRYAVPGRAEVERRYGAALARPETAYTPPDPLPAIEESRAVPGPLGAEYWLRFAGIGAAAGGPAWAHVYEPDGVRDPPSLVYGHGVGVELDSLDGVSDGIDEIVRHGVRLVRLEAPWHGRRRLPGRYGGEPFFATQPLGALDLFAAQLREFATLIAWCRRRGSARVALGGTSLGALASQLAACHARRWPAAARPDALFLATTGADVVGLVATSSLAHALGLPRALAAGGWTAPALARWRPLIDPLGEPAPAPADIVMLLGRTDDVTPFADGRALAARWRVPAENLFLPRRGHFSAAVGLLHDPAPLRRLAQRLHRD